MCMIYDKADQVFGELFKRYQIWLETSIKGNDFIFDGALLLYCQCYKIKLNRVGSCTDFPDCIKNKKGTINYDNDDDEYF